MDWNRRDLLKLSLAATGAALCAQVYGQPAGRKQTLRLVPSTDLVFLDPVFSTALVSVQHGYHVFDTLYGVDGELRAHPQMAEGHEVSKDGLVWTIRLRDGLWFHDGSPVKAVDCVASLGRWGQRDIVGRAVEASLDRYEVIDDKSFKVVLKKPFPRLLEAFGKPHSSPAFIMPERLAKTSPKEAIKEMVGSGPYRFIADEWKPGNLVVYQKFDKYVPRKEPAEWTSGGKVAKFERIEWHVIRDQSTALAALQRGEVDWMQNTPNDLVALAKTDPKLKAAPTDPLGTVPIMRFNHLNPPFDNPKLRRFVMEITNQEDYLAALTGGDKANGQTCHAMFPCNIPGTGKVDGSAFGRLVGDKAKISAALKATGYAGEKVVIINPTDSADLAPLGLITADVLARAGMNVDLQSMDWGTMLTRRASMEPVDKGGWSIYHSSWPSISLSDPMQNVTMRGNGKSGWPGWYGSEEMERLVAEWINAPTEAEQTKLMNSIHALALNDVPSLPLGIYYTIMVYRTDLKDVLGGSVRYPWSVNRA